jgi:hypothetical protein
MYAIFYVSYVSGPILRPYTYTHLMYGRKHPCCQLLLQPRDAFLLQSPLPPPSNEGECLRGGDCCKPACPCGVAAAARSLARVVAAAAAAHLRVAVAAVAARWRAHMAAMARLCKAVVAVAHLHKAMVATAAHQLVRPRGRGGGSSARGHGDGVGRRPRKRLQRAGLPSVCEDGFASFCSGRPG